MRLPHFLAIATIVASTVGFAAVAETQLPGVTEFSRDVELHSMATGVIAAMKVREGDQVTAGQALLEIDGALQKTRVAIATVAANAVAQIEGAKADYALAASRSKRIERAVSRGGAAKWELSEAQLAVTAAQARLIAAEEEHAANEARLALETASLAQFSVSAPFDGQIVELMADEGGLANGRDPLLVIVGGQAMKIVSFLPADRMQDVSVGDRLTASLGAPVNDDVEVELVAIDPRIEPGGATVRATFEFDNQSVESPAGVEAVIYLPDPS